MIQLSRSSMNWFTGVDGTIVAILRRSLGHLIAAARPNFMKVSPLYHALKATDWAQPKLVHTGQHYDHNMSDAILQDLRVPEPDFHLGVGSGSRDGRHKTLDPGHLS